MTNMATSPHRDLPLVSVIVPCFNSAGSLKLCLDSVKAQTYPHIEMVVIDKYSADNTVAIARSYGVEPLMTRRLRSVARNLAAAAARGEYLVFLDSDIELSPGVVAECVDLTRRGAKVITFPEAIVGSGFWYRCRELEARCYLGDDAVEAPRFMSKAVFHETGGFDDAFDGQEDWDLREKILTLGYPIWRNQALTYHHEGQVSLYRRVKKKYLYAGTLLAYMRKHRQRSVGQVPLLRSAYFRHRRLLLRDPVHTAGFALMKTMETLASGLGVTRQYLQEKLASPSPRQQ